MLSYNEERFIYYSAQIKNKALTVLGFWRHGIVGRRSSANSAPTAAASMSVEGAFVGHARETFQQQRTTAADVTVVSRPSSLRRHRPPSIRRGSPTIDKEKDEAPAGRSMDRSVQTSDELLQPLIGDGLGLRQRRGRAAADDASSPPVQRGDSLDDLIGGACRPWRRHSLSSLSPLSSRLASPVQTPRPAPGDLNLDDVLGDHGGVVSPGSLSPLSIAEMSSPPRRWRRFELQAPGGGGAAFPLRCYDADDGGRRWGSVRRPPPPYENPNYIVGMPPEPVRAPAQRAPLRRQKPCLGGAKPHLAGSGSGSGRSHGGGVGGVGGVVASPASSRSSGAGGGGRDDGGDSSEGAGAKSLSTVSLEDAISRSMSRLSDEDNVVARAARRVGAVQRSSVTHRGVPRNAVTRNDVTGTGRSSAVTSRRPPRPVVLSSDV